MPTTLNTDYAVERAKSADLDAHLGHMIPVLDHGFVRAIDYMGNDAAVVQMARVSYGTGTTTPSDDRGLIRYLMRHHHSSPFEGCEIKLHVKLPVFVARQWIRHRTANVNEYSARYSILDREFYVPEPEVLMQQSTTNKQGRAEILDPVKAEIVRRTLIRDASRCYDHYEEMIYDGRDPETGALEDEENAVNLARELARINLPISIYTQWYWKIDLHNLLHFLRLRADPHAQYEIRVYAEAILKLVDLWVPMVAEAARDYIFGAVTFSRMEMAVLRSYLRDHFNRDTDEHLVRGLLGDAVSLGEAREFLAKLKEA